MRTQSGNGRIARAIADMALARADGSRERHYGMSTQIEAERAAYYRELELRQRGGTDATPWLEWFLDCLGRAVDGAGDALAAVLHKVRVWKLADRRSVNGRQRLALNRMLDGWRGTSSRYAKLAQCSAGLARHSGPGRCRRSHPERGRRTQHELPHSKPGRTRRTYGDRRLRGKSSLPAYPNSSDGYHITATTRSNIT